MSDKVEKAISVLLGIAEDESVPSAVRINAACAILAHVERNGEGA